MQSSAIKCTRENCNLCPRFEKMVSLRENVRIKRTDRSLPPEKRREIFDDFEREEFNLQEFCGKKFE